MVREAVDKPRASVQSKGSAADLVTATDLASEEAILGVIRSAFPNHAVLGEEGGVSGAPAAKGRAGPGKLQPEQTEWWRRLPLPLACPR